jgi:hypothetical protein
MAESEVWTAVAKGGVGAVVLSVLYGLSLIINAWRGGNVAQQARTDLAGQVAAMRAELSVVKADLADLTNQLYGMRYQRDQARLRVNALEEKHGQALTTWPSDPPLASRPAPTLSGGPP